LPDLPDSISTVIAATITFRKGEDTEMRLSKFAVCCVLFIGACVQAHSQTQIRVNIPFDFTVANRTLPAGQYYVVPAFSSNNSSWRIADHRGNGAFLITNGISSPMVDHKVSLLFRKFAGQYALIQFWPSDHEGRNVVRPKIARTMIAESQIVQIAALN
jgi:hypothetical protein